MTNKRFDKVLPDVPLVNAKRPAERDPTLAVHAAGVGVAVGTETGVAVGAGVAVGVPPGPGPVPTPGTVGVIGPDGAGLELPPPPHPTIARHAHSGARAQRFMIPLRWMSGRASHADV